MADAPVAMITKHSSDLSCFVIMIYDQFGIFFSAYYAFFCCILYELQIIVGNYISESASAYFVPVRSPAFSAPTIQSIFGFVVKWKEYGIFRLFLMATGA